MSEYEFSIPSDEREAVARGIARMKGNDPSAINEADWSHYLMWAGVIILAGQYVQQTTIGDDDKAPYDPGPRQKEKA